MYFLKLVSVRLSLSTLLLDSYFEIYNAIRPVCRTSQGRCSLSQFPSFSCTRIPNSQQFLEIPLIMREHNGGQYHIWTWFLDKNITELPLQLALPLLYLVPMYFLMGFDATASMFWPFYGYTVVAASCATGLGYLVSCLSRRVDIAPILGILFMMPFILFGGLFLKSASTPSYFRWLQALSPVMYAFHCLMRVFWPSVDAIACASGQLCVAVRGRGVLAIHAIDTAAHSQRAALLSSLGINIAFRLLGAVALWCRLPRRQGKPE